jgi:hypothetical protein
MKHVDVQYQLTRKAVENGEVNVSCIPTDCSPSNIFTKSLAKVKFHKFVELLGLCTT